MTHFFSWTDSVQTWAGWLLCVLYISLALILNWPVEYGSYSTRVIGHLTNHSEGVEVRQLAPPVKQILGGWPFTWYVANQFEATLPAVHCSWIRLAANCLLFGCSALFFWNYERRARRQIGLHATASEKIKRRFSLSDLVLVVTVVAIGTAYWQSLARANASQIKLLVEKAGQKMIAAKLSGQLPAWLTKRTSYFNTPMFLKVSDLELDNPDDETLAYALSLNTVRCLYIGGGTYDLKLLERLRELPMLCDLRVSGRELTAEALAAIASCKQLQSLNLLRTNITAEGVRALGEMPKLQVLNLIHTEVRLSELGRPEIADNCSILFLPHSNQGGAEELLLEDWNKLTTLRIAEYDAPTTKQPVKVTLRRLPELNTLSLDQFRRFDLTLDGLHKLQKIETIAYQASDRNRRESFGSGVLSLTSLKVRDATIPNLIEVSGADLQAVDIQSTLPVAMRFHSKAVSQNEPNPLAEPLQKLLDQLGQCSAPMSLDLTRMDLRDLNFDQFAELRGLTSLAMLPPPNVNIISKLSQLGVRELDLRYGLPAEHIGQVIASMPTLERLTIAPVSFDAISIQDHGLKEIRFDPQIARTNQTMWPSNWPTKTVLPTRAASEQAARLVDLPNLRAEATYFGTHNKFHIENVPSLTKLRIFRPLPSDTVLRGLRDLQCFSAGGKELRDEHFDAVIACKDLKTLCLIHSSISQNRLRAINELTQLRCLSLTGSQVTDDVLACWKSLENLRVLRLKQTQVTSVGLRMIPKLFPKLERLSIDTPIDEETLNELVKCEYLIDLGLHHSKLGASSLKKIQALPSLMQLDLTGCTLDAVVAQSLQKQFTKDAKNFVVTDVKLEPADAELEVYTPSPQLGAQDRKLTNYVRLINESRPFVQFNARNNPNIREIWLDDDEIWDEAFMEPREPSK